MFGRCFKTFFKGSCSSILIKKRNFMKDLLCRVKTLLEAMHTTPYPSLLVLCLVSCTVGWLHIYFQLWPTWVLHP